jgi:Saxitoxin biosynthesis operon protein SxtJ
MHGIMCRETSQYRWLRTMGSWRIRAAQALARIGGLKRGEQPLSTHERISRREDVVGSSDRGFGFVFAVVFLLLAALKLWQGSAFGYAWLALSAAFAAVAALRPSFLAPLNRLWLKLGLLLHRVVTPVIMGLLFYLVITPMGLIMRLRGTDFLRLKRDPRARSYWIERTPPGPAPASMKNQF